MELFRPEEFWISSILNSKEFVFRIIVDIKTKLCN